MSGELEAAGDAITGGLVARAIDRDPGAAHGHHAVCQNCGTALAGDFCHACGQSGHIHRSLAAIWHDLAHGVLHFEGKIWRTLPMLVTRPGELTRRYIAGERARFVSPLALFLFSVFLMFAIFSALGGAISVPDEVRSRAAGQASVELDEARATLAGIERERGDAASAGRDTSALDAQIAERQDSIRQLEGLTLAFGNEQVSVAGVTGWKPLDKGLAKAAANPNLLVYKLQANAYKFSWALIPMSLPFVWLLFFWRRDLQVYDHAVFVTYSLSFMSLLAIVLTLLGAAGAPDNLFALAPVVAIVHMSRHLRGAYRLSRRGALVRLLVLLCFASIVVVLFVALLLGLGLLG